MLYRLLKFLRQIGALFVLAAALVGCVSFPPAPTAKYEPVFDEGQYRTADGAALALRRWPVEAPRIVILAVHGMNDYSRTFDRAARWWAENHQIATYAYDQRGFGASPDVGRWLGAETMKADLYGAVVALRKVYPDTPLFVLGHSMGGAVVISSNADRPLGVDGLILVSPGVWGGETLPISYRLLANLAASIAPDKTLTGERTGVRVTDNVEVMREQFEDPLVIKETRTDAVLGVVRIMDEAFRRAGERCTRTLLLIGQKDEIIPLASLEQTAGNLCGDVAVRRYDEGWHLLLGDLQREAVFKDIVGWLDRRPVETKTP